MEAQVLSGEPQVAEKRAQRQKLWLKQIKSWFGV
jgi:general stress protein 26